MIFTWDKMIVRIFYLKDILKLARLVFYLSFIIYFNRANIVQLDGESKRLYQPYWSFWKYIVRFFNSEKTFIWTKSRSF